VREYKGGDDIPNNVYEVVLDISPKWDPEIRKGRRI
jgi:hypothetical protein